MVTTRYKQPNKSIEWRIRAIFVSIYGSQITASKIRKHPPPAYSREELIDWVYKQTNPNIRELTQAWVDSGFKKALIPSIDRINSRLPYRFDNIRLVTWGDNNKFAIEEKMKPVEVYNRELVLITEYPSASECDRSFGMYIGFTSDAILDRDIGRKTHLDLLFAYKDDPDKRRTLDRQLIRLDRSKNIIASRRIMQFDLKGNLIAIYNSAEEAGRLLDVKDPSPITRALKGEYMCLKHIWIREAEFTKEKLQKSLEYFNHKVETRYSQFNKKILVYDTKGNVLKCYDKGIQNIIYEHRNEDKVYSKSGISTACTGAGGRRLRAHLYNGKLWFYDEIFTPELLEKVVNLLKVEEDNKAIIRITPDNRKIIYKDKYEAAKDIGEGASPYEIRCTALGQYTDKGTRIKYLGNEFYTYKTLPDKYKDK